MAKLEEYGPIHGTTDRVTSPPPMGPETKSNRREEKKGMAESAGGVLVRTPCLTLGWERRSPAASADTLRLTMSALPTSLEMDAIDLALEDAFDGTSRCALLVQHVGPESLPLPSMDQFVRYGDLVARYRDVMSQKVTCLVFQAEEMNAITSLGFGIFKSICQTPFPIDLVKGEGAAREALSSNSAPR